MKTMIAAVVVLLLSGAAWAESTEADWKEHAQPLVDVYAQCGRSEVDRTWRGSATPDEIATAAIAVCEEHLEALRLVLVEPPFSAAPDVLEATMDQIKSEARSVIAADVEKRRKE